jgi:ATP-dependent helicase/nuclease subunit A
VGDFGQSIYRFRGAEVKIFSDVGKEIEKGGGENFSLTKNFRSTPAIISLINYLQSKTQVELDRERRGTERIFLHGSREEETGRPPVEILVVRGEKGVERETCRRKEANLLACKIKEIVEKESREYGQIAVLFRSLTYAWIYEMAFRKEGIPYTLLKGGKFFGLQEIRDMMNTLKVIEDDGNEVALYGLLRSPLFGVSDDTIYQLCTGTRLRDGFSFWRKKGGISREEGIILKHAVDFLEEARGRKDSDGIYELISWILEITDFQEVLLGTYAGERKVLNVNKLLQLALSFETKGLFTLNDFIRYIDQVSVHELYESEAPVELHDRSVVKVMTIHSAKGLEFPVVFLPDLAWYGRSEPLPMVYHPDYGFNLKGKDEERKGKKPRKYKAIAFVNRVEDNLESGRLFYVATTRACDKLILSASLSQQIAKEGMFPTWIHRIWDLLPDKVKGTTIEEKVPDLGDEVEAICEVTSVVCGSDDDRSGYFESASPEWHADAAGTPLDLSPDILSRVDPVDPSEYSDPDSGLPGLSEAL